MSEPQDQQSQRAEKTPINKQRALNALVFLLAAAVCVQAYVVWEMNDKLDATVTELDAVKQLADNADWKVIPKPAALDDTAAPPNVSPTPSARQTPLDPIAQLGAQAWEPFSDMERMRREMDRLMGRMQPRTTIAPRDAAVSPVIGVSRNTSFENHSDSYVVKAYLPGIDAANVSVQVENQLLIIRVKQEQHVGDNQDGHTVQRRFSGQSIHRVPLPEPVDGAAMKISLKDDVLVITVPKAGRASAGIDSDPSQSVRD